MATGIPYSKAAAILASLWFFFFCACLAVPCFLRLSGYIETDNLRRTLDTLSNIYSANLAVVLGFYIADRSKSSDKRVIPKATLVVAVAATLIWNGFIITPLMSVEFGGGGIEGASKFISQVAPKLSWLVAPALAYFFAARHAEES